MKTQLIKQTCPCCGKEVEGTEVEVKFGIATLREVLASVSAVSVGIFPSFMNTENEKKDEKNRCTVVNYAFHCDDCDFDWNEDVKVSDY